MKKFLLAAILIGTVATVATAQKFIIRDAEIAADQGDYEYAKERIDLAFEDLQDKYKSRAYFVKGRVYYGIAIDTNYTSLEKDAAYVSLQSYIDCIESERGESKQLYTGDALQTSEQGVPDITSAAYAVYAKSISYYNDKDYDNTLKYWDLLIKGYETDTLGNIQKMLKSSKNDIIQNCAIVTLNEKDNKKARMYLNRLINDPKYLSATAYVQLSLLDLEKGDTAKALEVIEKGRKKIPDDKTLFNQELNLYTEMGRTDILVKKLDEVIRNEPNNILYLAYRGGIFSENGRVLVSKASMYSDSASEYSKSIRTTSDPKLKETYIEKAAKFAILKDSSFSQANMFFAKAEKDYKEALLLDPYYFEVLFNAGVLYFNKTAEVIAKYNNLDALKPENKKKAEELDKKRIVLTKKALEYLLKAEEVKPNDEATLHAIQQAYAQLNENEKSMEYKKKKESLSNK